MPVASPMRGPGMDIRLACPDNSVNLRIATSVIAAPRQLPVTSHARVTEGLPP